MQNIGKCNLQTSVVKADMMECKLKPLDNSVFGSPEELPQMSSRLKRRGKTDINQHP